jgi:hypothetical protein
MLPRRLHCLFVARAERCDIRFRRMFLRELPFSVCTKSGHSPVDGLHSIENTHLADAGFSLTKIIESVKQNRSLTVS